MEDFDPQQLALDPTLAVIAKPRDSSGDQRQTASRGTTRRETTDEKGESSVEIADQGGEGHEGW